MREHAIYVVCLRLMQLSDTYAHRMVAEIGYDIEMSNLRSTCADCCSDCLDVFDNHYYISKSVIQQDEMTFAGGYLMRLVHILRNVSLAQAAGRPLLSELFVKCDSIHLKLFYQNLLLTTQKLDPGSVLDAKTIMAIAANWLTMRQVLIYTGPSHMHHMDRLIKSLML